MHLCTNLFRQLLKALQQKGKEITSKELKIHWNMTKGLIFVIYKVVLKVFFFFFFIKPFVCFTLTLLGMPQLPLYILLVVSLKKKPQGTWLEKAPKGFNISNKGIESSLHVLRLGCLFAPPVPGTWVTFGYVNWSVVNFSLTKNDFAFS